jgi:integrase
VQNFRQAALDNDVDAQVGAVLRRAGHECWTAAAAGLDPRLRFHYLRYSAASLLIAQGASVEAVQAQLGHASATMTLDRLRAPVPPDELEHLADRLDRAWREARADPLRTRQGPEVTNLAEHAR